MIRYALLLDTETTGLQPPGAKCIEVAAMLYDVRHASPFRSFASLLSAMSNEAEHVNRIKPAQLAACESDADWVWAQVGTMAATADVLVAHRAEFDRQFVPGDVQAGKPWACTKIDFDWPGGHRGNHLVHLALAYGLGVVSAHRAMADVDTMARILTRVAEMGFDLQTLFVRAMRPKRRVVALVSYEKRQLAKDSGFFWNDQERVWYRDMALEDVSSLPFQTRVVG